MKNVHPNMNLQDAFDIVRGLGGKAEKNQFGEWRLYWPDGGPTMRFHHGRKQAGKLLASRIRQLVGVEKPPRKRKRKRNRNREKIDPRHKARNVARKFSDHRNHRNWKDSPLGVSIEERLDSKSDKS